MVLTPCSIYQTTIFFCLFLPGTKNEQLNKVLSTDIFLLPFHPTVQYDIDNYYFSICGTLQVPGND